jgi:hypothetical protein
MGKLMPEKMSDITRLRKLRDAYKQKYRQERLLRKLAEERAVELSAKVAEHELGVSEFSRRLKSQTKIVVALAIALAFALMRSSGGVESSGIVQNQSPRVHFVKLEKE